MFATLVTFAFPACLLQLSTRSTLVDGRQSGKLVRQNGNALLLDSLTLSLGDAHGGENVREGGDDLKV